MRLMKLLAAGEMAEVWEWGDNRVLKLQKWTWPEAKPVAFREASTHAAVETLGLPVPKVWGLETINGRWGIVFDRVPVASFADHMRAVPDHAPRYFDCMARLHSDIHRRVAPRGARPSLKERFADKIRRAEHLSETDKAVFYRGLSAMPDSDRLGHGDFGLNNILGELDNPVVIDWALTCRGDPAADVCRCYLMITLYGSDDAAASYLDAYLRYGKDVSRQAVLDWMPYVAIAAGVTDRWLLGMVDDQLRRGVNG